jgi:hypothetical protein
MPSRQESQALAFWRLLKTGARLPHGTRNLTVDALCCAAIARDEGLDPADVFAAFGPNKERGLPGVPVKEAFGICSWLREKVPEEERTQALLRWAWKRGRMPRPTTEEEDPPVTVEQLEEGRRSVERGRRERREGLGGTWTAADEEQRRRIVRDVFGMAS